MRVAVIGAGASGLTAIKACKEEGIDVICYERSDNIGGLWRYRDNDEEGLASVAKSTIINTSKEITAFSDFPPPKEFPNYMHNTLMFKYLQLYAKEFELIPHIKFQHRVKDITQADDYGTTGKWEIHVLNLKSGLEHVEVVGAVMICTGHHVFPYMPSFPGQKNFRGDIIHTHTYKKPDMFEDKKVVVVGVGNSGGDAAVEVSHVASQVYLSTRRGSWVFHRVGRNGRPYDDKLLRRFRNILFHILPFDYTCTTIENGLNSRFDHKKYQLQPKHRILQQHPMINDSLPNRILSGRVIVKGNIQCFVERGVIFEGEDKVTEVDKVIFATGYEIKFPFVSKDIIKTVENQIELYKFVYPPHLQHPTLAVIGLIQIVGGLFPISEMQSRWFVRVLKKNVTLPSEKDMKEDVKLTLDQLKQRYYSSKRHTIQVDYIDYLDEIASYINAKPNFLRMLFTDFDLFRALMMGPSLPYQYRLQGPNSWHKARETILSYEERFNAPLQSRFKNKKI
ncbi:dimethylaniline monooxygenase [N-oxide-forming] 5-like, partial [Centruroides sculpturatus]|uniref:dimethylaniline monooxygenase [N-oxide-forming] 5-like n=1 Tax=Centruroides sculpturatus TaxID=218467 RepID=UPI000C6D0326